MKWNKNNHGVSLIGVVFLAAIVFVMSISLMTLSLQPIRLILGTKDSDRENLVRSAIYSRVNCVKSLKPLTDLTDFSTNPLKYCSTALTDLKKDYLVQLVDDQSDSLYEFIDPATKKGRMGGLDLQAGCIEVTKQPTGIKQYCLVIHQAMLIQGYANQPVGGTPGPGSTPQTEIIRKDPGGRWTKEWSTLFKYPVCCEQVQP
jgi:hypothetical protein